VNQIVAVGDCWVCQTRFVFDVDDVPSIWIDATTARPTWPGSPPATAERVPVCYRCAGGFARVDLDAGVAVGARRRRNGS
jgi:hypothetical protein